MSNSLEKWHASNDVRRIEKALAVARQRQVVTPVQFSAALSGEIVDFPRICAVHDRPYVARYISDRAGCFRLSQTIRISKDLFESQYADGVLRAVQSLETSDESCPWCGGHGFGSVHCHACDKQVCYGRTVSRYFHCRPSCGGEGKIIREARRHSGVTPCLFEGDAGSV